jgi:ubiquinone/menaquinone biosynthesis C-methylase UbiE
VTSIVSPLLHKLLDCPLVFEFQQRFCNNYSAVYREFSDVFAQNGKRIIDIGCSTGACANSIVDMQKNDYVGVDIERHYIEAAAKRSRYGKFYAMDARHLDFPDASFDLAMFVGVMHHMNDTLVQDCLAETFRVLKPDGRVIVAEPVFTPGRWLSNVFLKMDRGRHIRADTGYRALFGKFQVERERFFYLSVHRFCSFVLKPDRRTIRAI